MATVATALHLASAGAQAIDPPPPSTLLAGLVPLDQELVDRWSWSGAWLFPVGDSLDLGRAPDGGVPAYRIRRGLARTGSRRHQGVDLSNRQGGGPVRAAATGLVVRAAQSSGNGYGDHVVLAHRLPDGRVAYSVYAHLEPGSIQVREGDPVPAGCLLGRVGRSGRASNDHLHFEVRIAARLDQRWERAEPVPPLAFVRSRLPGARPDTSWAGAYLEWAECADLIPRGARGDASLDRAVWWRMLARAGRAALVEIPADPDSLRDRLVGEGLLPPDSGPPAEDGVGWQELSRDLVRLAEIGVRLPPCPVEVRDHQALCAVRLEIPEPARHPKALAQVKRLPLTLADACLALADFGGPAEP